MLDLRQQKIEALPLLMLAALIGGTTLLSLAVPDLLPWSFLALAAAAVLLFWAAKWDIVLWAWFWVFSFGLLDWPEWRIQITGFFNLTVPRLVFLAAGAAFFLHLLLRGRRIHFDRALLWAMLVLVAYCAISATASGWLAQTEAVQTAPYFRFLEALLFPFVLFFLVYNATRTEGQIKPWLILLSLYGWYALYIGYLQYAAILGAEGARQFIWPSYINDPKFGIHFDRARGAFGSGSQQAILLILLFYADLYLLRRLSGPYRWSLALQAALAVPGIFFTGMRSAYLAFLLCGAVWLLASGRRRFGAGKLALAAVGLAILVAALWPNLAQTERQSGGLAQRGPVISRYVLLFQTWDIFKQNPLTGAGFGHFVDAQHRLPRDPAALGSLDSGLLVEHNLFLNMIAETGVLGLAAVVAVFVLVFRQSAQLYQKLPPTSQGWLDRSFVVLFWVALVSFLTDSMFRDVYWDAFANGMLWCFAGMVVAFNRLLEPHPLDLPSPGVVLEA